MKIIDRILFGFSLAYPALLAITPTRVVIAAFYVALVLSLCWAAAIVRCWVLSRRFRAIWTLYALGGGTLIVILLRGVAEFREFGLIS